MFLVEQIRDYNYSMPVVRKEFKSFSCAKKYGLKRLKLLPDTDLYIYKFVNDSPVLQIHLFPSGLCDNYEM